MCVCDSVLGSTQVWEGRKTPEVVVLWWGSDWSQGLFSLTV